MVGGVLKVDVQLSDGCGRGREHAADEILLEEVNESFAFALTGRWGGPLVLEMGGDIGRGAPSLLAWVALSPGKSNAKVKSPAVHARPKFGQPIQDANSSKLFVTFSKIFPSQIRPFPLQYSMTTKAPSTGLNHSPIVVSVTSIFATWLSGNLNKAARSILSTSQALTTPPIFSPRNTRTRLTSPYYAMWSYRSDLRGVLGIPNPLRVTS